MPESQQMKRRGLGYKPKLTFTSDFHELLNGDLIPGPCLLRYDPLRIVPRDEISALPSTQRPITAHVRLHPSGELWEKNMRFRPAPRLVLDEDPTGEGTMLLAEFPLPKDCQELECWFSYLDNQGGEKWDSAMGANFWIRFPTHDLPIVEAKIVARDTQALDLFKLEVESLPAVETIGVRWRYTTAINDARYERPMAVTILGGRKSWSLHGDGAPVSSNTPLAFDLVYRADGHTFTDDNQGTWYIVSR
jgi:hypothetical protein